jgi:hypothetical protein
MINKHNDLLKKAKEKNYSFVHDFITGIAFCICLILLLALFNMF